MQLTERDMERLVGVHTDLVLLVRACAVRPPILFTVLEGLRTEERQAELVASGASQTMNSRHLTGHAVDLAPIDPSTNEITWEWDYYYILEPHIKEMAEALYININWGGDWTSFKDGPHWELNWDDYPA